MNMNDSRQCFPFFILLNFVLSGFLSGMDRPNVLFVICDDLNDYIEGMDGHPQSKTPNIKTLAESGVQFQNAFSNNPVCAPSRASLLTGIYPHNSGQYFFDKWEKNKVISNSKMIHEHFRDNGYKVAGAGKILHHDSEKVWKGMEHFSSADYGPFAYDGKKKVANPSVPRPFSDLGHVVGSYGPLSNVPFKDSGIKNAGWVNGDWKNNNPMKYVDEKNRGFTPDESNADWAVNKIKDFENDNDGRPFFMAIGFVRPHTPLHAPKKFFDLHPLDQVEIPLLKEDDVADTPYFKINDRKKNKGHKHYRYLKESYPNFEDGLRVFTQAYLACVSAVDHNIGKIVQAIDNSRFKKNTIIILTSDHGWHMGEKEYIAKNTLWEESCRIPFIVRAPGISRAASVCTTPISLIDLYPTLVDLCDLQGDTKKNSKGMNLDGNSIRSLLIQPSTKDWSGPKEVLSMVYGGPSTKGQKDLQNYTLRSEKYRYIRYKSGEEELYDHEKDSNEWENLASNPEHALLLKDFRAKLAERVGI